MLSNTVFSGFGRVDYIIVIFLFFIPFIREDTMLPYSLIFGLFYDYLIDAHIGTGVLLFIFFSAVKIGSDIFFDLTKLSTRLFLSMFIILAFTVFNLFYFNYEMPRSLWYGLFGFTADFAVYVAIFLILELGSAFSVAKR